MQSDYDRGQVLTAYVQSYGVEPSLREPFFAAVRSIKSDYERRRVLTEVAKKGAIGRDVQQPAFEIVSLMSSDYDRAEVLLAFVNAQGIDSANRQAFVSAAERLKSSHDQNRVLAALVRRRTSMSCGCRGLVDYPGRPSLQLVRSRSMFPINASPASVISQDGPRTICGATPVPRCTASCTASA